MRTASWLIGALILGIAVVLGLAPAAAATKPAQHAAATPRNANGAAGHLRKGARPKFRPSRPAAAEARRLGAMVGQGCNGKADIARSEHQWVVLCSNGKTFLVDTPAGQPGTRAVECSLAGTGPQPACFGE